MCMSSKLEERVVLVGPNAATSTPAQRPTAKLCWIVLDWGWIFNGNAPTAKKSPTSHPQS